MNSKYKALLKEKDYIKVVVATFITRIGDGIDMIAFSWLVYEITGSTVLVATICGVNMIPNLTIGFVSGVLCKYVSEKTIMWVCDFGRGICVALIAILYLMGYLEVWHLFVITFMNSSFEAFRAPASTSIFPKILKEEKRENGLAIQQSLVGVASLVGLGCGPLCIGLFGLGGAIIIDAVSFLICGMIILLLKHISVDESNQKLTIKSYAIDLKEGFQYAKKDKLLVNIAIFACVVNALFVPMTIFEAPYVKDYLHMGSEGIAIFGVGSVLGMVIISPFIPKIKEYINYSNMFAFGGVLVGLVTILYGLMPYSSAPMNYIYLGLGAFFAGVFLAMVNFPLQIAMYGRVEQAFLARYSALMGALALGAQPLASFIFGWLSDCMPLDQIYIMCGVFAAILFFVQYFNKTLKKLNQY